MGAREVREAGEKRVTGKKIEENYSTMLTTWQWKKS